MSKIRKIICAALAALMITAVSCSEAQTASPDAVTTAAAESTEVAETEPEFTYPDVNYDSADYRVFNFDQLWNMYIYIDIESMTGDALDDAVYERNRAVEEKLNFNLKETKFVNGSNTLENLTNEAQKLIAAGDDAYEVMFLPVNKKPSLITDNYLLNLAAMPELQFDKTWWDSVINDEVTLNGQIYFASGAMQLMAFDSAWCLFFNENIMADHSLETPYQLVRDGKWTVDELYNYCSSVASLNGDTSYKWNSNNACLYGMSAHGNAPEKFTYSCDELYVKNDGVGNYSFTAGGERFMSVMEKLAKLLGEEGTTFPANNDDFAASSGGYCYLFANRRSMFLTAEIKTAQLLRDMDDTFGIVPFPKYDETQESYRTNLVSDLFYLTVPTTCQNTSFAATVSEVLTYESYKRVFPIYYDVTVEQKGLRNDDSIEMLKIMRTTRGIDVAVVFGWNNDLRTAIGTKLYAGNAAVTSDITKYQNSIEKSMDQFFDFFG